MSKGFLTGKVAIITGSNRGIGKGIAELFADNGANVVITNEESKEISQKIADDITAKTSNRSIGLKLDLRNEEDILNCIEQTIEAFGKIDILVNNAGVQIIHPIEDFCTEDWDKLTDIHFRGSFLMFRECIRHMKSRGQGGKIIFTGSVHSFNASSNKIAYISSKHGQAGMVRAIASECAKYNISANLVAPGFVLTELAKLQIPERAKIENCSEEYIKKSMVQYTVDGEFTTVEEVAQTALFFASFEGLALTGQSLIVSHGWCMK
jgi:3-hydroxybutyrate dehydrogenase